MYKIISQDIYRVKQFIDIVDLAGRLGLKVKKRGRHYFVQCPFHIDSPGDGGSCDLFRDTNAFRCFGCGASGDVFGLYCQIKGIPRRGAGFYKAVTELHGLYGMGFDLNKNSDEASIFPVFKPFLDKLSPAATVDIAPCGCEVTHLQAWNITPQTNLKELPGIEIPVNLTNIPFRLVYVPDTNCFVLVDKKLQVCSVWVLNRSEANFMYQSGMAKWLRGQEFEGSVLTKDSYPIFRAKLVVENPLDYVALKALYIPVAWGIWGIKSQDKPMIPTLVTQPLTISALIALHLGKNNSSEHRLEEFVDLAGELPWLLRQTHLPDYNTLTRLDAGGVELVKNLFKRTTPVYTKKTLESLSI